MNEHAREENIINIWTWLRALSKELVTHAVISDSAWWNTMRDDELESDPAKPDYSWMNCL